MEAGAILENVTKISQKFDSNRAERQLRRKLDPADFNELEKAGFLLTGVPAEMGGIWENVRKSTRPICEILRVLGRGDSSVALVSCMHPAVLSFWLATPEVPSSYQDAWEKQRQWIFETALDGAWWGTITSEPGSGGDIAKTKTIARKGNSDDRYRLTGQKHFGSGSGISTYMITTAIAEGSVDPDLFYLNMKNVPWDGTEGVTQTSPWDGHGMIATQSHSMKFENFPITRCAWPESLFKLAEASNAFINCLFTSVIVGITDIALETARQKFQQKNGSSRAYEQVEWVKTLSEGWLIQQAYEGMLRAVEEEKDALNVSVRAQMAIADLSESLMGRICRIMGGGSYSRHSPFGFWFEDVRALGFLRPPWGLAYDKLYEGALDPKQMEMSNNQ